MAQSVQWLRRGLDERDILIRFPAVAKNSSLLQNLRNGPGAAVISRRVKCLAREADRSY
jgi:hypothetical protein